MTEPAETLPTFMKWFRRTGYHREFSHKVPLWHLAAKGYTRDKYYREYVALCGYTTDGVLDRPSMSRAIRPKGATCSKCLRALAKSQKASGGEKP
jgi:hypothetical protein